MLNEALDAYRLDPCDADAFDTSAEHRAELRHHKATIDLHLHRFVSAAEPPLLDRLARERISNPDAGMLGEVGRSRGAPVFFQIDRRGHRDRARLEEFLCDQ